MPPPGNRWNQLSYLRSLAYAINARAYALSATAAQLTPPVANDRATDLVAAYQTSLLFGWGDNPALPSVANTYVRSDWDYDGKTQADASNSSGNADLSRRAGLGLAAPAAA